MIVLVVYKMLRKLLICILASLLTNSPFVSVGFEECSESSPLIGTTLKNSLEVIVGIKGDHVVIGEMDLKLDNIWDLLVSVKVENSPDSIQRRDVASVNPPLDLVLLPHFECTMIWPFLDVLECVLEGSKSDSTFHVDVAVKISIEERWV